MKSIFISSVKKIDKSWQPFLSNELVSELNRIEKVITRENYTPVKENVLRFLEIPLSEVKIIILGQDPYPQEGTATGRAFEVNNLNSWTSKFRNSSLKNILRSLCLCLG